MLNDFLRKQEFPLYLIALAFVLTEVFATSWLVTEDGPAHIYNAVIARELLLHPGDTFAGAVFELNGPVPNCLGHVLLALFSSFLPLELSDKILHVITIAGGCLAFRFLCRQVRPDQPYAGWLIFPFVYSGIFYFGFYNFGLGIVLFLLATAAWLRAEKRGMRNTDVLLLLLICTLLFFTHLIPFLLFVLVAGGRSLLFLFRKKYPQFLRNAAQLSLMLVPAAALFAAYYSGRTEIAGETVWADPFTTLMKLAALQYLAVHSMSQAIVAQALFILLFAAVIVSTITFLRKRKTLDAEARTRFLFWGACWLFLLALTFAVPDDFGGSGAMTFRLIEISGLFLLFFLAAGMLPEKMIMAIAAFSFAVVMVQTSLRGNDIRMLSGDAQKVMRISGAIRANSTGAYVPVTGNWLRLHLGELAFAEKKSALLSNYETVHDFFPLLWRQPFSYDYRIGGLRSQDVPCALCYWPEQPGLPQKEIDYVLLCKDAVRDSACFMQLYDSLEKHYVLKRSEPPFYLYESRESSARQPPAARSPVQPAGEDRPEKVKLSRTF